MKKSALFALLAVLSLSSCQDKKELEIVNQILGNIRQTYAPDKRVALFEVEAKQAGRAVLLTGETNLPDAKKDLLHALASEGMEVIDSLGLLPSPGLDGKHLGIVNVSVCNIRSGPKHSAELATQALLGAPLRVWNEENGFFLVQTPDDYLGWLDKGGFVLMDSSAYHRWMLAERSVCIRDYEFAYEHASESSAKMTDLVAGNIVQTFERSGAFTRIGMPDGRTGFVRSSSLVTMEAWLPNCQPDAVHILTTAREMMGRPYLWGGTSGKGMDCSGFTKMVFYLNGIQLPRDASQQVHVGEPLEGDTSLANLQPGDLLFFGKKAGGNQKEKITHVAIYMGDGNIIHASRRVEIESLRRGDPSFVEYRLSSYVRSRRVIGSEGQNGVLKLIDSPFYRIGEGTLLH